MGIYIVAAEWDLIAVLQHRRIILYKVGNRVLKIGDAFIYELTTVAYKNVYWTVFKQSKVVYNLWTNWNSSSMASKNEWDTDGENAPSVQTISLADTLSQQISDFYHAAENNCLFAKWFQKYEEIFQIEVENVSNVKKIQIQLWKSDITEYERFTNSLHSLQPHLKELVLVCPNLSISSAKLDKIRNCPTAVWTHYHLSVRPHIFSYSNYLSPL